MEPILDVLRGDALWNRALLVLAAAFVAHALAVVVRRAGAGLLARSSGGAAVPPRPKLASVTTLVVSSVTFAIYFTALGLVLGELGISLTAYFASATVIGLAVGFGSQGLVQDVVIGLTLIFSDVLDVGDVADIGGQTGRVESIGLRFTTLRTLLDQRVIVPNRNVGQINRYRNGYVRAYVDVQVPADGDPDALRDLLEGVARGMHAQHGGIILRAPEVGTLREAGAGGWSYLRMKIHLWPGQGPLVETVLRQRLLAGLRQVHADYPDWGVVVTWRASA